MFGSKLENIEYNIDFRKSEKRFCKYVYQWPRLSGLEMDAH